MNPSHASDIVRTVETATPSRVRGWRSLEWIRRRLLAIPGAGFMATVGTGLAATVAGALAPPLLGEGTQFWVLGLGILILGFGIYLGFTWLRGWQERQRGIFLAAFALGPHHKDRVAEEYTRIFGNWVRQAYPNSSLLEPYREPVATKAELDAFLEGIEVRVGSARAMTGQANSDLVLWFGGRLDVAFRLGQHLATNSRQRRPVWVVSDTDWTYEDSHLPMGAIPDQSESPFREPKPHTPDQLAPSSYVMLNTERPVPDQPQITTSCRGSDGQWRDCEPDHRHQELVLGVDLGARGDLLQSRIPVGLQKRCPGLGRDLLLVLVTASALDETPDAYRSVLERTRDGVQQVEGRLAKGARRSVALAAPAAFAVLLGARFLSPHQNMAPWHTLAWEKDRYVFSFGSEPGNGQPALDPGVRIRNFTLHDPLVLHTPDGVFTFPREGIARCQEDVIQDPDWPEVGSLPRRQIRYGTVSGLPDPQSGTVFLVSQLVVAALPDRTDLAFPCDVLRDEQGTPTGFRALGRLEAH